MSKKGTHTHTSTVTEKRCEQNVYIYHFSKLICMCQSIDVREAIVNYAAKRVKVCPGEQADYRKARDSRKCSR